MRARWPWWTAVATAVLVPTATARRTDHVRTWQAAAVHVAGIVTLLAVGAALLVWSVSPELARPAWGEQARAVWAQVPGLGEDPLFWAVAVVSLLVAEAAVCVSAWLVMAWGARDETVPEAYMASLRRLWIATPHAVLVLLVAGLATVPLQRTHQRLVDDWARATPLEIPDDRPITEAEAEALDADWQRFRAREPWLRRNAQPLMVVVQWVVGVWALVVVLRVSAARPWGARCRWPPVCDGCGQSLLGRTRDDVCAECGLRVAASVGERARPGPWEAGVTREAQGVTPWASGELRRAAADRVGRWWHAVVEPVRRPTAFGHALQAMHPEWRHRMLLAVNAVLAGLLATAGALAIGAVVGPMDGEQAARAALLGVMVAMATVGAALVLSSLVGSMATRMTLSPLLPAAAQGACHLSGLVVAWVAGNFAVAWVLAAAVQWGGVEALTREPAAPLIALGLMVANITALVVLLVLLWRIVMAARFANW